jgi:murein DD-endopeptidase MepM/ murein hydrolase activator NlpD
MIFPLPFVPSTSYKGGNGFGGDRHTVRVGLRHAANDLAAPPGTPVLAMDRGVVLGGPDPFFRGTFALAVRHPQFIARYWEIGQNTEVHVGDEVVEGQVIAYVGDQPGNDMLHLEFFTGRLNGPLSFRGGSHPPYDRRDDVFDGVRFLDLTANAAGRMRPEDLPNDYQYRFIHDKDNRLFLAPMDLRDI